MRFPEFTEQWERYRVSDFLDFYSTNSLSWEQLDYDAGEIKNLHYGLIHKGQSAIVNIDEYRLPFIKESNTPKSYTLCKDGDIAFADASENTNDVAKAVEFVNCDGKKIICGLHTIHGRDRLNITCIGYKAFAFSSPKFCVQINKIAQGTKVFSISAKNFNELFIGVPSLDEQKKIISLLSLINERIATQNKIIAHLESLIKGLSIELTSKNHPNTRLKDCLISHSSVLAESNISTTKGDFNVYGATGVISSVDTFDIDEDAILIIKDGAGVGRVLFATGKYSVIGTLNYLTAKPSINLKYIHYCLSVFYFAKYVVGSGIPHIYFKDYSEALIYCPSQEKQHHIVKVLDSLNIKLETEVELLEKYKEQKYYLLQKLFI